MRSPDELAAEIVAGVRRAVGPGPLALHRPDIGPVEVMTVSDCVKADPVGYGYVDALQEELAVLCGVPHVVAVSSGTAALHLALMVAGVGPGDEVWMPSLTFAGTANAVRYCGAFPLFVDIEPSRLGIDSDRLDSELANVAATRLVPRGLFNRRTGRRIAAIVAVHMLGRPCDMDAIMGVAHKFQLPVIEDAAQALGSLFRGRPCGGLGSLGTVSFNGNKIVTTNGGGAVLVHDKSTEKRVWRLATTARIPHPWHMAHDELAWNYRMGNINAALGLPQLQRLDELLEKKRWVANSYRRNLDDVVEVDYSTTDRWNNWLNAISLPGADMALREHVLAALHADGIQARALFTPLHLLPQFQHEAHTSLDETVRAWARTICLPSGPELAGRPAP